VVPTTLCKTETDIVRKHAEANKCGELFFVKDKHVSQIVMPNSGVDLHGYFKNLATPKMPIEKWIHLLGDIFAGLKILDTHGYIHLDIKSANVLFDGTQLRIFDFSLSIPSSAVYDKNLQKRLIYPYYPYPFEFILVYYNKYNPHSNSSLMNHFKDNLTSFGGVAFNNFLRYHSAEKIATIRESIRNWVDTDKKWFETIASQTDKIDLYGVGMLCIDLHNFLDFTTAPTDVQTAYVTFITAITEIDVRDRLSLKDAMSAYKKLKKLSATTFSQKPTKDRPVHTVAATATMGRLPPV
jgi:serine/threonine protein kinase